MLMFIGAIVGAIVAAGSAAAQANQEKKAGQAASGRPKHRRFSQVQGLIQQGMNNRQRALIAMAQAHENYAKSW